MSSWSSYDEVAAPITAYSRLEQFDRAAQRFGIHRVTSLLCYAESWVELRRAGLEPEETTAAASLHLKGWSFARLGAKFGVDALLCGGRCERSAFTKQAKQVISGLILTAKFAQMLRLYLNRKYGAN